MGAAPATFTYPTNVSNIMQFNVAGPFNNSPSAPYNFAANTKYMGTGLLKTIEVQSPKAGGGEAHGGGGGGAGQGTAGNGGYIMVLENIGSLTETI